MKISTNCLIGDNKRLAVAPRIKIETTSGTFGIIETESGALSIRSASGSLVVHPEASNAIELIEKQD